jgi:dUTP pyrophosphatase
MDQDLEKLKQEIKKIQDSFDDFNFDEYDKIYDEFGLDVKQLETDMSTYSQKRELGVMSIHPDAVFPKYNYMTDSGFDLHSVEEMILKPFGRGLVSTGLCFDIPEGYELQIRPKSGLAINQGLTVLNTPGTADCFSEDMKILCVDGEKKINELRINDIVFSMNETNLEIEKDTITKIFETGEQDILIIETELGVLEVTPNSEIYTKNGIKFAKDLDLNDEIMTFF